MAALSAERKTLTRNVDGYSWVELPVATTITIYQGGLVNVDTNGRIRPATAAVSRRFVGLAAETKVGVANGSVLCRVEWGMEAYLTSGTLVTSADIGGLVYVVDDQTVGGTAVGTAGVRVPVGDITDVDSGGTWVRLRQGYAHSAVT